MTASLNDHAWLPAHRACANQMYNIVRNKAKSCGELMQSESSQL